MSIRFRLTLLYTTILALTLAVFGAALYVSQARSTLSALQRDLTASSELLGPALTRTVGRPPPHDGAALPPPDRPVPFETFSSEQAFRRLPEREVVRVLDASGNLLASPFGAVEDTLPLSEEGLAALANQQEWWEEAEVEGELLLIYSRPIVSDGKATYILQVARSLAERQHSLRALGSTLVAGALLTILLAFGMGWVLAGASLQPIQRITNTAQAIGAERDLGRRVDYRGPADEVGRLATTFNNMLGRLQEAQQRLTRALEMQRNFVADVSHELRTPLTTIRGNLDLLRRRPALVEGEQDDILTDLVEESDRLIRLVHELLILARADARQDLTLGRVPVQDVVEQTCRQARQLDPQRVIVTDAGDVAALGDRDAVKQVLLILLDNALKHSQGTVRVTAESSGEHVRIGVHDVGPGIPADKLEHLFDRFYRADADPSVPGFGLGLAIAKALVEGQGGQIAIESEVGKGSTVWVMLRQATGDLAPPGVSN